MIWLNRTWMAATLAAVGVATQAGIFTPDYVAPTAPVVSLEGADAARYSATQVEQAWWGQFEDPTLSALVDRALAGNLDMRIALARVRAARAAFVGAELDRLPTLTLDGAMSRSKEQQPGITTDRVSVNSYQAGFDASWELDLWGRVASEARAAGAQADAATIGAQQMRISVAADVARYYFLMRGAQQRLAVAERNLRNLQSTLDITRARVEAGRGTELDVARARANLAGTEATLPPLQTEIKLAQYRLAVLTGTLPGQLSVDLAPHALPPIRKAIPIGDPSQLLQRRPDVAIAERQLAAANAQVAATVATRFPRISLNGFIGFLAARGGALGEASARAWSFTPSVDWPALHMGSVEAQIRASKANEAALLAMYDKTVLQAVEEADGALVGYSQQQDRLAKLMEAAQQSQRAADIARIRYKEGEVDFLTLLDAERTQLQAEDAMAQAEAQSYVDLVAVYKAMGGGWQAS